MAPNELIKQLQRLGRRRKRRAALSTGLFWLAGLLTAAAGLALSDLWIQYGAVGRRVAWSVLVLAATVAVIHLVLRLRQRQTPAALAAWVERCCPELDNHLINFVQFATHPQPSALEQAYLEQPVPGWSCLDVRRLFNRRRERLAGLALLLAAGLLGALYTWIGPAWTNAVLRIANPFSPRPAATLARLLRVLPGNATVQQGEPLRLLCEAHGRKRQPVLLELWPADGYPLTIRLGELSGAQPEEFAYPIAKVAADFRYRFRAGDARSEVFRISALAPLAFKRMRVQVRPPAYTGLPEAEFNGLKDTVRVPQGAQVAWEIECNRPATTLTLAVDEGPPAPLQAGDRGRTWSGAFQVVSGGVFRVVARDERQRRVETLVGFQLVPDRAPEIRVLAPLGRALLTAGSLPSLRWEVADDYGLDQILLEKLPDGNTTNAVTIAVWPVDGRRTFATNFTFALKDYGPTPTNVYRIVAVDRAPGSANRAASAPLVFETAAAVLLAEAQAQAASNAVGTLAELVELQRVNLEATRQLHDNLASSTAEDWGRIREAQVRIQQTAGLLLNAPHQPLGALTDTVRSLYRGAMREVIEVLERVPVVKDAEQVRLAGQSVALESLILRQLTYVASGMERVARHQAITGLLAMLDALVNGQTEVLTHTRAGAQAQTAPPAALADRQDRLASDANAFVDACRKEAANLARAEAEFAKSLTEAAELCVQRKVSADMLTAAEHLERQRPGEAVPLQERALTCLKEVQTRLNEVRVARAQEQEQKLAEAVRNASEKMEKLVQIQAEIVEALRAANQQKDLSGKPTDELVEELAELKPEMSEALLKIATDLQIFPELPVGNDLVEDISQTYEEMKQVPGSSTNEALELGLQKEDFILSMLEMAATRLDDMEMWLPGSPDRMKRNVEAFDQAELPQVTTMPLPTELEDIIGDLLEQQEKITRQADDSASNQGSADAPMGWDIADGEYVNYSAKGKSGNEAPDHRELDGRSLVGREGMSDGETVAGSGKIHQGDDDIEKRRTHEAAQSGQVMEEGHSRARATGGGKLAGYGEERGMAGQGPRRDSPYDQGSLLGLQALLRRQAEALYGKASMMHIRTRALDEAVANMRRAENALAQGYPIRQVAEFQHRAVAALKRAQAGLDGAVLEEADTTERTAGAVPDEQVATALDEAPPQYRELVADYFKSLSGAGP